jgi:hypothetical protein
MLPSVIGSIGWSKRATPALPRSMNSRHYSVAGQPCVTSCAECRQVFCPDEAAGSAVRSFAGARANHIRSPGRGDDQHDGERKQGRQKAASSPNHVRPLDSERIFRGLFRARLSISAVLARQGWTARESLSRFGASAVWTAMLAIDRCASRPRPPGRRALSWRARRRRRGAACADGP